MSLRELIGKAQQDLETYRPPDVKDCHAELSKVLEAAGFGHIEDERIESINEYAGMCRIETSRVTARGCHDFDLYELPSSIIDAEDPIRAAAIWELEQEIKKHERALTNQYLAITEHVQKINELRAQLQADREVA
jgi:hypothetical protein